jgi:hypothetical protein
MMDPFPVVVGLERGPRLALTTCPQTLEPHPATHPELP